MSRKNPICTEKTLYVQKKICTVQSFSKDGFLAKPEAHGAYSVLVLTKKAFTDCEAFQSYRTYKKNNGYPLFNLEFAMY